MTFNPLNNLSKIKNSIIVGMLPKKKKKSTNKEEKTKTTKQLWCFQSLADHLAYSLIYEDQS